MKSTFDVQGMSCGHCVSSIENALNKIEGILDVSVSLENAEVHINANDETITPQKIIQILNDLGLTQGLNK